LLIFLIFVFIILVSSYSSLCHPFRRPGLVIIGVLNHHFHHWFCQCRCRRHTGFVIIAVLVITAVVVLVSASPLSSAPCSSSQCCDRRLHFHPGFRIAVRLIKVIS
jgi:hypothetical protein